MYDLPIHVCGAGQSRWRLLRVGRCPSRPSLPDRSHGIGKPADALRWMHFGRDIGLQGGSRHAVTYEGDLIVCRTWESFDQYVTET